MSLDDKSIIGHVQINEEDNIITWMLSSADLKLSLKRERVASGLFNIGRNNERLCYFKLNCEEYFAAGTEGDVEHVRNWH
ncbi:hypothetical protein TKK_0006790 [Trichogramma kaykai]